MTAPRAHDSRRRAWATAAALFAAVFAYRFLSYTGFPNDHFVYLARAQQILLGAWPVRDFVDPGFLLMYVASAAGLTVFGHNLIGEAVLVFGGFAAAAALTFPLARAAAGSAAMAVAAVALQALAYPRSYSYPKLFLHALAITLCWKYLAQPTTAGRIGLALLVVIAGLFRPDHGVVIGLMALFAVVWADTRLTPARIRSAVSFAAVTAAILLPWLVFVQSTAGIDTYLRSVFGFTATKADVGRMGWPMLRGDELVGDQNAEALLYYTFLLLPVVGALALWRRRAAAAPMPDAAGRLWVVILLAACANATLLRNPLHNRLGDVGVPQAILAAWLLAMAWRALPASAPTARLGIRAAVATAVALLTLSVLQLGDTRERLANLGSFGPGTLAARAATVARALYDVNASLGVPTAEPLAPAPLIVYVKQCTNPTDRLMYLGYAPQMYFFARRGFAAGQVVFEGTYYTSPEEQALMLRRLEWERVPVVALPDEHAAEFRRNFSALAAYLDANYERAGTIDLPGDRRGDLLVDRRRPAAGSYEPFGWPCFAVGD